MGHYSANHKYSNLLQYRFECNSFPGGSDGEESACNAGDPSSTLGWKDSLEEEMATHSSILAWKMPWTEEEPGGL